MKNRINKLTAIQEKDKFILRRVIEDVLDAEEFLRQGTQMENQISQHREQHKKMEKDLKLFSNLKKYAQKIRMIEIEKAKKEREKALEKEEKDKTGPETTNDNS